MPDVLSWNDLTSEEQANEDEGRAAGLCINPCKDHELPADVSPQPRSKSLTALCYGSEHHEF